MNAESCARMFFECLKRTQMDRREQRMHFLMNEYFWDRQDALDLLEQLEFIDERTCQDMMCALRNAQSVEKNYDVHEKL